MRCLFFVLRTLFDWNRSNIWLQILLHFIIADFFLIFSRLGCIILFYILSILTLWGDVFNKPKIWLSMNIFNCVYFSIPTRSEFSPGELPVLDIDAIIFRTTWYSHHYIVISCRWCWYYKVNTGELKTKYVLITYFHWNNIVFKAPFIFNKPKPISL